MTSLARRIGQNVLYVQSGRELRVMEFRCLEQARTQTPKAPVKDAPTGYRKTARSMENRFHKLHVKAYYPGRDIRSKIPNTLI